MIKTITTIFTLFISLSCFAQNDLIAIDSILQTAAITELFEGTVLIADDGEIVYHKSFGYRDANRSYPIVNDTHFSIASITKMFTAILILQLAEEGKFQLSDNIDLLLPEYAIPESKMITVHHLLLHISGLPNEDDMIYRQVMTTKEYVHQTLGNTRNRFGEFNYANIDFILLGLIIEKFDKTSWHTAVQERILNKVSMKNTGFLKRNNYPDNFAYSFSYGADNIPQSDPLLFIESYYAAGCMFSSAKDLLKLDQAMYGTMLLSDESKKLMFTSYPEYNYSGYSVWTYNYPFSTSNPKVMERRGGILGANSVMVRMLETNKTIIILSNNNKFNPDSFGNTKGLKEALMIEVDKN